ncbi:MAG: rimM [Ilumatobacteraceae bacterium]|nr:rimM [Ilumatobacteraceae bacterium]
MTEPSPPGSPEGMLEVGVVRRPHGVKGDTYVDLVTDREDRLAVGSRLWCKGAWRTITFSKRLPQRWLVHFQGFDDRTAVEALTNQPLMAPPVDDADALWVHDLVGAAVVEAAGVERGHCVGVLANPAHDLLELDSGALVPVVFIVGVADGVITIDPPDGLFDLDS